MNRWSANSEAPSARKRPRLQPQPHVGRVVCVGRGRGGILPGRGSNAFLAFYSRIWTGPPRAAGMAGGRGTGQ